MNSVVITGIGFTSSIGTGREEVLESLRDLRHGFVRRRIAGEGVGPELVCGSVDGFDVASSECRDWTFPGIETLDPGFLRSLPPHGPYAVIALEEALHQAGLKRDDLGDGRTGLFCASAGSPRMLHHRLGRLAGAGWMRGDPMAVVSTVPFENMDLRHIFVDFLFNSIKSDAFNSIHNLQAKTPLANAVAMVEAVREFNGGR